MFFKKLREVRRELFDITKNQEYIFGKLTDFQRNLDAINRQHKKEGCEHKNIEFHEIYEMRQRNTDSVSMQVEQKICGYHKRCNDCNLTLEEYKTEAEYHRAKIKHYEDQIKKERELLDEEKVK